MNFSRIVCYFKGHIAQLYDYRKYGQRFSGIRCIRCRENLSYRHPLSDDEELYHPMFHFVNRGPE